MEELKEYKKVVGYINAENETPKSICAMAEHYNCNGMDAVFFYNYTRDESSKEEFLHTLRTLAKQMDLPFMAGLYVERFEDIKKALYTGASHVVVKQDILASEAAVLEGSERFGNDKIYMEIDSIGDFKQSEFTDHLKELGICGVLLKHVTVSDQLRENMERARMPILLRDSLQRNDLAELMKLPAVIGVATNHFSHMSAVRAKLALKEAGISVNTYESRLPFSEFKLNSDGLIPVVTQEYQTNEVLMVAYMNEEAYEKTLETGKMTYFSRSRNKLWLKGETSGHYQYVKHLMIDCDNDTILARVKQVGAACHTGMRSCFYSDLMKREYQSVNPLTVLLKEYQTIRDRKKHPKEGSYTNYLFDKGIDKILKKCGEEATEIVIAAKNPDAEELKYEIADFLYHMMVLMVECDLDWEDVLQEIANR